VPDLELHFLGAPHIQHNRAPVAIGRRKAIALLAYLAVTGQIHSRDVLATLFWPELDQSRARAALRRNLSALGKALDGDWLDADRETISLRRDTGVWVDVEALRALLSASNTHVHPEGDVCGECLASLADAAALYNDDFLAGFTLRDCPEFDDWQYFQRESLRREAAGALEQLARMHGALEEFEAAFSYARRWLALDPLDEQAHSQLMLLYAWNGQRNAALRQYQECVRVLEEELGVPPQAETTELYEAAGTGRTGTLAV
jgi:DNA-binding SARP family transcriptional activator